MYGMEVAPIADCLVPQCYAAAPALLQAITAPGILHKPFAALLGWTGLLSNKSIV
jgi:hypothetical protein